MKKRKNLTFKALISFLLLAVLIILFTCFAIAVRYVSVTEENYQGLTYGYTRAAADYIDGDTIQKYLETGEKDDYYETILGFLNSVQKESSLKYYYVFVPFEDDLVYIWDANKEEGACPLGYHEEYMEGGREAVAKIYNSDPEEEISIARSDTYGYIASAYSPVYNSDGEPVAVVGADIEMIGFRQTIINFMLSIIGTVMAITIVFTAVIYIAVKRVIITPIGKIDSAAAELVEHLEDGADFSLKINTGDELEELANSFNRMNTQLRDYMENLKLVTAEKERIGAELSVATQIQADMLPSIFPAFPGRKEVDIYATMTPAKEVGGDFYDFFLIDDDHLALVMADVSGKGVPAALFMVIAKTLIKNHAQLGEYSPAKVLMSANEQLCEGNKAELFVTVWLAVLEISTGKGKAANAGHEHPVLRRKGGKYELVEYRHSPAVAAMEGIRFREHEFELRPGDSLFVYTDGVAEATNIQNELFGTERMLAALNKEPDAPPETILKNVKSAVDEFVGAAPQFDDITMLGFTYFGTEGNK